MRLRWKSLKASSPRDSIRELPFDAFEVGHLGIVRAYSVRSMLKAADTKSCMYVVWKCASAGPAKFTNSMAQMKPIVPHMRMGGKSFMVSMPALVRALNATELASPIVGMKKATDTVYRAKSGPNCISGVSMQYVAAIAMNVPARRWQILSMRCACTHLSAMMPITEGMNSDTMPCTI